MVSYPEFKVYVSINQQAHSLYLVDNCGGLQFFIRVLDSLVLLVLHVEGYSDVVVHQTALLDGQQMNFTDQAVDAGTHVGLYLENGL